MKMLGNLGGFSVQDGVQVELRLLFGFLKNQARRVDRRGGWTDHVEPLQAIINQRISNRLEQHGELFQTIPTRFTSHFNSLRTISMIICRQRLLPCLLHSLRKDRRTPRSLAQHFWSDGIKCVLVHGQMQGFGDLVR